MKKLFFMIAFCTLLLSYHEANAQMCQITGNVEPTLMSVNSVEVKVDLQNYNSYMVTVQVYVSVASKDGAVKEYSRTVVLKAGETKTVKGLRTQQGSDVDINSSSVNLVVQKCS